MSAVQNYRAFSKRVRFTPDQVKLLRRNSFVVWPGGDPSITDIYANNDYLSIPSFVTTDLGLHIYHDLFDATLRTVEQKSLLPRLEHLTAAMLRACVDEGLATTNPELKRANERNVAYFGVALKLLRPAQNPFTPGEPAGAMADWEDGRIERHEGFLAGRVFPYKIDYSQFVPRGHYARSSNLKRYFKAMMWYGLLPFAFFDENGSPRLNEIRMALLLADSMNRANENETWSAIYEPTTLFSGTSNNLTPIALQRVMVPIYGRSPDPHDFADPEKLAHFVAALRSLAPAKIQSAKHGAGFTSNAIVMKFMGQRDIPDSEALQSLVNDRRWFPSGLDAMAIFGSSRAREILDANPSQYNPLGWADYVATRDRFSKTFATLPPATWKRSLYWGWLYALKSQLEPAAATAPTFMRNVAWTDLRLSSSLSSWAELRHDTILYGTQATAAEMGDGGDDSPPPPPFVKGYVEPNVKLYERLIQLTKLTRDGLVRRGLMDKDLRSHADALIELLSFLKRCGEFELQHKKLSRADYLRIRYIEGEASEINRTLIETGVSFKSLSDEDQDMAVVADVATGNNMAFTVASGHADEIAAIVPVEGKLVLARGSVFSYYEFLQPISNRLSDHAWKQMLVSKRAPARPKWTRSFLSAKRAPNRP